MEWKKEAIIMCAWYVSSCINVKGNKVVVSMSRRQIRIIEFRRRPMHTMNSIYPSLFIRVFQSSPTTLVSCLLLKIANYVSIILTIRPEFWGRCILCHSQLR
jgi:hypothetical protein